MQLLVLLWKLAISRYKRYIQTALEFLFCTLMLYLLFTMSNMMQPYTSKHEADISKNIYEPEGFSLSELRILPSKVVYYPKTDWTDHLMSSVGRKLGVKNNNSPNSGNGLFGTSNMSLATSYMKTKHDSLAFISFEDTQTKKLPQKLKYTIRSYHVFMESFKVNTIKGDTTYSHYTSYGDAYKIFLPIQWAVDTAYIQLRYNKTITQDPTFKEFVIVDHYNPDISIMVYLHVVLNITALALIFMFHVGRVVEDRISGVQALLTMSGVSSIMLNLSHYVNAMMLGIYYSIAGTIFYSLNGSLIVFSNGFLIWVMFLLYFSSVIMFGFFTAFALPNKKLVVASALAVYFASMMPITFITFEIVSKMNGLLLFLTALLPHQPLYWFMGQFLYLESNGLGLTFDTLTSLTDILPVSPLYTYAMLLVQTLLYGGLGYYLSLVRPAKYVTPLPWLFLCRRDFWRKKVCPDIEMAEASEPLQHDIKYFEQEPSESEIGIKIIDVSKAYNNNYVLSNLNLNIYKGEITVLLGHNGAGKTTILSIIAGMNKATHGKVLINGLDRETHRKNLFNTIGVCPQENMFFRDLSVLQHIIFFTMLRKNVGYIKAKQMSMDLLKQLDLSEKKSSSVTKISGGMMRRVQLGCALAGDADILILDEPTSGLDVETRRELWDLLLRIRGRRSVLLTTHFMEEADILGDRVAALHHGRLRCHATPDYLKKAVGQGYLLTLVTIGLPNTSAITDAVLSNVPEASFKEATLNCITFSLPPTATNQFPRMFQTLEDNRDELGIESIGVGTATLEEVFLTLCSDVDVRFAQDTVDAAGLDNTRDKLTGCKLALSQLRALFSRQIKLIIATKYKFLFMQIFVPIFLLVLTLIMINKAGSSKGTDETKLPMDLGIYSPLHHKKVLMKIEDPKLKALEPAFKAAYNNIEFEDVEDIDNVTLTASLKHGSEYRKYLLGLNVDENNAQVRYSTSVRHAVGVALGLLTSLLAGEPAATTAYNQPIEENKQTDETTNIVLTDPFTVINISITIAIVLLLWLSSITSSLPKERTSGTRHIFMMYGCSAYLYWIFTWLYHAALCIITAIVPIIVITKALEGYSMTLVDPHYLGTLFFVLLAGSLPVLGLFYLLSMQHKDITYPIVLSVLLCVFGWIMPYVYYMMKISESKPKFYYVLVVCDHFIPVFTLTNTVVNIGNVAKDNAVNKEHMCNNIREEDLFRKCFASQTNNISYLGSQKNSAAKGVALLFLQSIFYMLLVILTQMGVFTTLSGYLLNKWYREGETTSEDPVATEEIAYVDEAVKLLPTTAPDAMLIHKVHKRYPNFIKKSVVAVDGVSFSIKKGECLGLVGVNGAGKSSMFSMMVGASHITRGAVLCHAVPASCSPGKYMHLLGFCPQHHSLDNFLTGEENLALLLKLRGFQQKDVQKEVDFWISIVALEKHRHKRMGAYSGGCKRRLAAAAALMAGGGCTLLDEPTAGVDVAARRALWAALRARRGAVLVASHSLDELEALCGRVALLAAGRLRALDAPAALRRRYATGHALHLNLAAGESVPPTQKVELLQTEVQNMFQCTLEDSNRSMLHYRITQTMKYSDLFTAVEGLKARFPTLIQDYTVKEPTLEQVFLSFAKQSRNQNNRPTESNGSKPSQ